MRRITAFIVAGAVLLFLICTIFSQPNRNGGSAKITVTFTGYTNEVTGGRLANFRISNLGGSGVFRWPDYTVEERGRVNPLNRGSYGAGGVLNPGQSSTCLLPAPSNSAPWRAVFTFSDNNWRRKLAERNGNAGHRWPALRRILPLLPRSLFPLHARLRKRRDQGDSAGEVRCG